MSLRLWIVLVMITAALSSCTVKSKDEIVSSPPIEHPEVMVESGSTPFEVDRFALLVGDRDGLHWAWDWFGISRIPSGAKLVRNQFLFLATTESSSCPIKYEGYAISGHTIQIRSSTRNEMCTADAAFRSIVLRLPESEIPEGRLEVAIEGDRIGIQRLAASARSLRESILTWFEDVPEKQLPVQGTLGGTMGATAIAFPRNFSGEPGDPFYVRLEDGHYLATWRYQVNLSHFWDADEVASDRYLESEKLQRRGFEVWEIGYLSPRHFGFRPYIENR